MEPDNPSQELEGQRPPEPPFSNLSPRENRFVIVIASLAAFILTSISQYLLSSLENATTWGGKDFELPRTMGSWVLEDVFFPGHARGWSWHIGRQSGAHPR